MTNWIEDVSMRRRYDDKPKHEKGRRAAIWSIEGYEDGSPPCWYWEVKEGRKTHGFGDTTSRGKALAVVDRLVRELGWTP